MGKITYKGGDILVSEFTPEEKNDIILFVNRSGGTVYGSNITGQMRIDLRKVAAGEKRKVTEYLEKIAQQ